MNICVIIHIHTYIYINIHIYKWVCTECQYVDSKSWKTCTCGKCQFVCVLRFGVVCVCLIWVAEKHACWEFVPEICVHTATHCNTIQHTATHSMFWDLVSCVFLSNVSRAKKYVLWTLVPETHARIRVVTWAVSSCCDTNSQFVQGTNTTRHTVCCIVLQCVAECCSVLGNKLSTNSLHETICCRNTHDTTSQHTQCVLSVDLCFWELLSCVSR